MLSSHKPISILLTIPISFSVREKYYSSRGHVNNPQINEHFNRLRWTSLNIVSFAESSRPTEYSLPEDKCRNRYAKAGGNNAMWLLSLSLHLRKLPWKYANFVVHRYPPLIYRWSVVSNLISGQVPQHSTRWMQTVCCNRWILFILNPRLNSRFLFILLRFEFNHSNWI